MKFNVSQITVLTKNQIQLFFKNYKFDIYLAGIFLVNLLINILGLIFINSDVNPSEKWIKVNILIVLNSLLVVILAIYVTINCFVIQIKNNIHKTELRYGYKVKNIYLSRILFIVGFSTFYLLMMFITSLLFFGFNYQNQNLYIYRLYISSFAWYAILIFLSIIVTLLLTRFLAESFATILATIFTILFILTPALSGISANLSRSSTDLNSELKNYSYKFLINENYKRNLYHDLMSNEESRNLYQDFQFVSKIKPWDTDELLMGWRIWNLKPEEFTKIENYVNLVTIVSSYFENNANQISSWNDIQEFHTTSNIINEPINKIIIKLQTVKEMEKYNFLLKMMKKYSNNFSILKSLNILHQLHWLNNPEQIKEKYKSSEEYLFVRTLNVLFFKLSSPWWNSTPINNPIEAVRSVIKKDRIASIFNPFKHFNLMFQSIDYNNKFLFNYFGQKQIFYSNVANINFTFNGDLNDLSSMLKLKQNVPVETIYAFYLIFGSLLIWLAFLKFNKKIKQ